VDPIKIARTRPRRTGTWIALACALVLAGLALWFTVGRMLGSPRSLGFTAPAAAYVLLYENDINGVRQWEVLSARRPFDGSDLTYRTASRPGPGAQADGGTISTRTGLFTQTARGVQLVSGRQPGPPSADLWLTAEMPEAISRGLVQDGHVSHRIAGRQCAVYRVADPPSGPLRPLDTAVGHDDLCISSDGLVLSETWTYHGSIVEQRTAVSVFVGESWPPSLPQPGSTSAAGPASTAGAVVTTDRSPDTFIAPPPTPPGFSSAGEPVSLRLPDPAQPGANLAATVVWAFDDGARVITVEAGLQRDELLPWSPGDTVSRTVRLAGLGEATTALRSDGPEVRIDLGEGRWVRVRGTVSLASLTAFASRLLLSG
jgi:hypothetical protein